MGYYLKLYDQTLAEIRIECLPDDKVAARFSSAQSELPHLLPLEVSMGDDSSLTNWLKGRVVPKNRAFVRELLRSLGLNYYDIKGMIDIGLGLSLNDSYWVVPTDFEGTFGQYNLYENDFAKALSLVAFTGYESSSTWHRKKGIYTSPELTLDGALPKAWRLLKGELYLYKGGTDKKLAYNAGKEPFSEFYASQIAERMGLDHVHYNLAMWKRELASTCKIFTCIDTAFVAVHRIPEVDGWDTAGKYFRSLDEKSWNDFASMVVFDALIYNEDRHLGNYGVLRDNHTGAVTGMAPLFDHGVSLFNFANDADMENLDAYAESRAHSSGSSFEHSIQRVEALGELQRQQLGKMINFQFLRHSSYNLPTKRLRQIERFLQKRVRHLLSL